MNIKLLVLRTTVERDVGTNERRQPTGTEQLKHQEQLQVSVKIKLTFPRGF